MGLVLKNFVLTKFLCYYFDIERYLGLIYTFFYYFGHIVTFSLAQVISVLLDATKLDYFPLRVPPC